MKDTINVYVVRDKDTKGLWSTPKKKSSWNCISAAKNAWNCHGKKHYRDPNFDEADHNLEIALAATYEKV